MADGGVVPDEDAVQRYFDRLALPVRLVAREVDGLVRAELPEAAVGLKYGVPFYARRAPVCYVSAARTHVTFGLLRGVEVPDASGRLVGTGRSPIRKAVLPPDEPVPRALVAAWLRHARRLDEAT